MRNNEPRTSPQFSILIVDDDPQFVEQISMFLSSLYEIGVATSGEQALAQVNALNPDVVLLDIQMGIGPDGFEVLSQIRALETPPQVLMLTGDDETKSVVKAIKLGAYHYVQKKHALIELVNLINLAALQGHSARRLLVLESKVQRLGGDFIVHDPVMGRVVNQLKRIAPTDFTVLLVGETGTGKELVARHLHELSRRSAGPFEAVNCASIAPTLLESELFGHLKGSFTDASRDRAGFFQQANGGTIFLDEIGLAPPELQGRLLRVLETGEIRRLGGAGVEMTNVRVIAASSRDLQKAVASGDFLEDLLYRLSVYQIDVPPLRHRPGDILPLAEYFLQVYSEKVGRHDLEFDNGARDYLSSYDWPGNVRELQRCLIRAVVNSRDKVITVPLLASANRNWPAVMPPFPEAKASSVAEFTRGYCSEQLERAGGNVTEAARRSGVSRSRFQKIIRDVGLRRG